MNIDPTQSGLPAQDVQRAARPGRAEAKPSSLPSESTLSELTNHHKRLVDKLKQMPEIRDEVVERARQRMHEPVRPSDEEIAAFAQRLRTYLHEEE